MNETIPSNPQPSIHVRRRWYYVFWVALLLLSAGALFLWEKPKRVDLGKVELRLAIQKLPEGTRIEIWKGPLADWPGIRWEGDKNAPNLLPNTKGWILPPVQNIPIAQRRWVNNYIPRLTPDLLVVRFTSAKEPTRYLYLRLGPDIHQGTLCGGHRLIWQAAATWDSLSKDPNGPPNSQMQLETSSLPSTSLWPPRSSL